MSPAPTKRLNPCPLINTRQVITKPLSPLCQTVLGHTEKLSNSTKFPPRSGCKDCAAGLGFIPFPHNETC